MVQLFTDSAANLTPEMIQKNNIGVIHLSYMLEESPEDSLNFACGYGDGFDPKTYYDAMRRGQRVQTSMANSEDFKKAFEEVLLNGNQLLYIGLSAGVSGTVNAALMALRDIKEKYSGQSLPDARVVDSKGASLGEGMLVLEAAKLIAAGKCVNSVADSVERLVNQMCQCFTVADLNHLKRSGRISATTAVVGGILGIRPILVGDENGKIVMRGKARGGKRAMDYIADTYERFVIDKTRDICITHADNEEAAEYLKAKLAEKGFCGSCVVTCFEPAMGAHVGPDSVALFFFGSDDFRTKVLEK